MLSAAKGLKSLTVYVSRNRVPAKTMEDTCTQTVKLQGRIGSQVQGLVSWPTNNPLQKQTEEGADLTEVSNSVPSTYIVAHNHL